VKSRDDFWQVHKERHLVAGKKTKKTLYLYTVWCYTACSTNPGGPVLYALGSQVGVVFYIFASHLCNRMWAEFQLTST